MKLIVRCEFEVSDTMGAEELELFKESIQDSPIGSLAPEFSVVKE